LLEAAGNIAVVAEAASGEAAYAAFIDQAPDVVIMDISLPGISGLEVLRRIRARTPRARVLMFSMHADLVFVTRALDAGALGYLTKAGAPDLLVEAARTVAAGRRFLPHDLAQELGATLVREERRRLESLTEREFEVLRLLTEGRALHEIAALLCVSGKTVANYQTSIRQKLGVDNHMQLLRLALASGVASALPLTPGQQERADQAGCFPLGRTRPL
jgi:DNA-binding NarL/FixJ family response regulator